MIDIEVANQAPSPTVDPSVHVILIGHSMGGIVGAEVIRLLASEQPVPPTSSRSPLNTLQQRQRGQPERVEQDHEANIADNVFMFPRIQGLMAFDTPFLGVAPGAVSYTAENHFKTASAAYGAITEVASVFGWGAKKENNSTQSSNNILGLLPSAATTSPSTTTTAPTTTMTTTKSTNRRNHSSPAEDAAATPSWQRWGRYAMFTGAAGAVAAGGAAALYTQRDRFSAGWAWSTSHLEFIGCLARPEELRRRLENLARIAGERVVGCANLYTRLGRGAVVVPEGVERAQGLGCSGGRRNLPFAITPYIVRSRVRTFCNLPGDVGGNGKGGGNGNRNGNGDTKVNAQDVEMQWIEMVNDKAEDETKAHMTMFLPAENPGFYEMAHQARDLILRWLDWGWYSTAGDLNEAANVDQVREHVDSDDAVIV